MELQLAEKAYAVSELYADAMLNQGPMQVAVNECFTGYIHSFHVRALLAHWKAFQNSEWLEAAKAWADWSVRMQGTYGDPAAYNMGYLFTTKRGIPNSWFVADTLDQAFALLNVADSLESDDELYSIILNSVLKYDEYIQRWYLGKRGFALGYLDGELLDKEPYHTATTRGICYYAAMYKIFGKSEFQTKGIELLEAYLSQDDPDSNFHGSPLHNRCYASDALLCANYLFSELPEAYSKVKAKIMDDIRNRIIKWSIANQEPAGYWVHDRFESTHGAAQPLDRSKVGPYSWGLLLGLEFFSKKFKEDSALAQTVDKAYYYLINNLEPGDVNLWGGNSWASVAIAGRLYPQNMFPYGNSLEKGFL
jgi:hypothetical protein